MTVELTVVQAGKLSYSAGLALQGELHKRVCANPESQYVILLEHWPVITLGKNSKLSHILASKEYFATIGVEVVRTTRGGEVTVHMPGQLVVYPILHLSHLSLMPKKYVWILEEAVIRTLQVWGIEGKRDESYPGVWVGANKICAVGVRIKDRTSLHGIAMNVENSLELFGTVVPCGIQNRGVTSITRELGGNAPTFKEVQEGFLVNLSQLLGLENFNLIPLTGLAIPDESLYNRTHSDI